jgi:hypothetical protein
MAAVILLAALAKAAPAGDTGTLNFPFGSTSVCGGGDSAAGDYLHRAASVTGHDAAAGIYYAIADRVCEDDASYQDSAGNNCAAWGSDSDGNGNADCSIADDGVYGSYAGMAQTRKACPVSCGTCPDVTVQTLERYDGSWRIEWTGCSYAFQKAFVVVDASCEDDDVAAAKLFGKPDASMCAHAAAIGYCGISYFAAACPKSCGKSETSTECHGDTDSAAIELG